MRNVPHQLQPAAVGIDRRSKGRDTAALSLLYDDQSVARLVDLVGPQRVLFASDYPLLSPRRQLERVTAVLDGAIAASVCGGNADKLLFG